MSDAHIRRTARVRLISARGGYARQQVNLANSPCRRGARRHAPPPLAKHPAGRVRSPFSTSLPQRPAPGMVPLRTECATCPMSAAAFVRQQAGCSASFPSKAPPFSVPPGPPSPAHRQAPARTGAPCMGVPFMDETVAIATSAESGKQYWRSPARRSPASCRRRADGCPVDTAIARSLLGQTADPGSSIWQYLIGAPRDPQAPLSSV